MQVENSLARIEPEQIDKLIIAYEPIWAIGTGRAATAQAAGTAIHLIRRLYGERNGEEAASALHIVYGESVTSANVGEFLTHPDIDGVLVGGASLKPDFVEIVRGAIVVVNPVSMSDTPA